MLNLFPIQFLAPLAYFLLRVCVGSLLLYFGYTHYRNRDKLIKTFSFPLFPFKRFAIWTLVVTELILGAMFIVGFLTQIAALGAMILAVEFILFRHYFRSSLIQTRSFYFLLFVASLSLFITGAGIFAYDLPI